MSIVRQSRVVQEGDSIILWGGRDFINYIQVKRGNCVDNHRGKFKHDDMIGKPYGTKVLASTKQFLYMLHPTPELWTKALHHRTQILYNVDISLVSLCLELKPGSVVIESGTGSGSLSTSMARTIAPNGKLYTFEVNEDRYKKAIVDFQQNELDKIITVTLRNACTDGFQLKNIADAVFLDLPSPWEAIESASEALKSNGRICSFSPCIEQVQKTCDALRRLKFVDIHTIEALTRSYEVKSALMESVNFEDWIDEDVNETSSNSVNNEQPQEVESLKRDRETFESNSSKKNPRKQKCIKPWNEVTMFKPFPEIRGHTGYLTFASKPTSLV